MSGRAYPPSGLHSDQFRDHTEFLRWQLSPDERVGQPPRARRKRGRWLLLALLLLAGGGWMAIDDKPAAMGWLAAQAETLLARARAMLDTAGGHAVPDAQPPLQLSALRLLDQDLIRTALAEQLPTRDVMPSHIAAPVAPEATAETNEQTTADAEPAADDAGAPDKPAPLPPLPTLTDPLQKKAEAAGLHPELSRALLQSLTPADFKAAAAGIEKAVAETPDDGVLLWPPKPRRGAARFRIHFVPGVSPACRRYVVGVGKSGWLTTALPMERCGAKPRFARSQSGSNGTHPRDSR